jgi:hypothetical protein
LSSANHHYIPQLYLKGFTANNGKLQVFDKTHLKFKKDKQTPKTVLFEKHRNTIDFKGCPTDLVERLYSGIETPLGDFFNHVRKGISQDELISKDGIYLLKIFVATQFWRMPLLDDYSDNYIRTLDFNKFGNRITIDGTPLGEIKDIIRLLKDDKGFRHYFRCFYLPWLTFDLRVHDHDYHCWKFYEVAPEEGSWDNLLTSDNPIIAEDFAGVFSFNSKLFLPLSKNQLVTYSSAVSGKIDLPAIFSTKLAMVMNSQSQKYLVGANREYIKKVIELQDQVYGNTGTAKLRRELFECI